MMTLPLNKKQKQLVEKSMDLVPIMIRSMTRTAAYVTEEEQQELCQIGYLAMCRAAVGRKIIPALCQNHHPSCHL